jgi:hypothetical protein
MDCILSSYTGEWGQWLQRARQAGQESRRARVDVQGPTSAHRTRSKHWCAQLPQPAATFTPCRGSARPGTHEGRARVRSPDMSMTGELLSRHQALVRRWDRSLARHVPVCWRSHDVVAPRSNSLRLTLTWTGPLPDDTAEGRPRLLFFFFFHS